MVLSMYVDLRAAAKTEDSFDGAGTDTCRSTTDDAVRSRCLSEVSEFTDDFPAGSSAQIPELSLAQTRAICSELLEGFSYADFQKKLRVLLVNRGMRNSSQVPGRSELALTVQKTVLPKYGIPGTSVGVNMMMLAMVPYIDDWSVKELIAAIDVKLGLPKNATLDMMWDLDRGNFKQFLETPVSKSFGLSTPSRAPSARLPPVAEGAEAETTSTISVQEHPQLIKQQVLTMCSELLEGFSDADFQKKLRVLLVNRGTRNTSQVPGRSELAFTVQKSVLPNYGIPGNNAGVNMMMAAMLPFVDDWEVKELIAAIDKKLGLPNNGTFDMLWQVARGGA